jgi:phospholipid transport system substrate-binding protein
MFYRVMQELVMRILRYAFLVLLVAGQAVNANNKDSNEPNVPNDPNDPTKFLQVKWDAILSVLNKKDIKQEVKEKEIFKIINPIFDFQLMAQLSLGRKHWPKLNQSEHEKFLQLFTERLKSSYLKKVMLYTDEQVLFKDLVEDKKKKTVSVPVELVSKDSKVNMLYKLRKVKKRWKIYDVEIQGVSILLTYRAQFDDILSKGTVKDLLTQLEKPPEP